MKPRPAGRMAACMCLALAAPVHADPLRDSVQAGMPALLTLYRELHANPELSHQEVATSAKLATLVRPLGFAVTAGVAKTGVVAVMRNGPGPVLLIRADMDGLPVTEQTDLPFASTKRSRNEAGIETGVMHACAHDTHMATWIGTARQLAARKDQWSGTLVMILQPAEEVGEGARDMIADGLFTRFPKPTHALAFHNAAALPAGVIGYAPGFATANVDSVDIVVKGVGGHGAAPQSVKDPIVLASRIVTTLQTLVSRELDPLDPGIVTVGSFQSGSKHNVIPDEATLLLTVRSHSDKSRKLLLDGIQRIARGEAIAAGVPDDRMPEVRIQQHYTPAVFNTHKLSASTAALFTERFGSERMMQVPPVMIGEDFGRYHHADTSIESLIFWVGGMPRAAWDRAGGDAAKLPSLHSATYAPDAEAVIGTATEAMTAAALDLLRKN